MQYRANALERSEVTEKMLLPTDIIVDTPPKIITTSAHHNEGSHEVPAYVHHSKKKPARRLSLSKTFPLPKPHRFKNSPCSCSATPRAKLAKFDTWYTVHGPWYMKGSMNKRISNAFDLGCSTPASHACLLVRT